MYISFAWTTEALLAGDKTVTRRQWTDDYARRFKKGDLVAAYDRSPRNGGRKVAIISLTQDPYKEKLADMPEEDVGNEGGLWVDKADFISVFGDDPELEVWVVRFEIVEVLR